MDAATVNPNRPTQRAAFKMKGRNMEHRHAVEILFSIHKDSKYFQGLLAGKDAYPIVDELKNLADFLLELADALCDVPQRDMFDDAPDTPEPQIMKTQMECPECHEFQIDGGPDVACRKCGFGPMPTHFQLTPESVKSAIAAVTDPIDMAIIEDWTVEQLEQAITWAREIVDFDGETEPETPVFIDLAYEQMDGKEFPDDFDPDGSDGDGKPVSTEDKKSKGGKSKAAKSKAATAA